MLQLCSLLLKLNIQIIAVFQIAKNNISIASTKKPERICSQCIIQTKVFAKASQLQNQRADDDKSNGKTDYIAITSKNSAAYTDLSTFLLRAFVTVRARFKKLRIKLKFVDINQTTRVNIC